MNGGVGIFFKDSLPLRVRVDLCFGECLVVELNFGRKKIFFTVVYRNPAFKANSPEFTAFLNNFKNLYGKIKAENPYACFFTGDFNGHSQMWYPDGDTNAEGTLLDDLFNSLSLKQLISEPATHYFRDDCRPSCIDLILTDQPNLIIESGVRSFLDPTVKHQIIFCKFNFKIPPLPNYCRRIWHFNRARVDLISQAVEQVDWEHELHRFANPTDQVSFFNDTVLNILTNFVPNETKTFRPRDPPWFNDSIRKLSRKQSLLYKKYRKNGFKITDKLVLDRHCITLSAAVLTAKEEYLKTMGKRLSDPGTTQKTYWKILNTFLNKCKLPRIPPLFVDGKYVTDCKEKATLFNNYFASHCNPFINNSTLPDFFLLLIKPYLNSK